MGLFLSRVAAAQDQYVTGTLEQVLEYLDASREQGAKMQAYQNAQVIQQMNAGGGGGGGGVGGQGGDGKGFYNLSYTIHRSTALLLTIGLITMVAAWFLRAPSGIMGFGVFAVSFYLPHTFLWMSNIAGVMNGHNLFVSLMIAAGITAAVIIGWYDPLRESEAIEKGKKAAAGDAPDDPDVQVAAAAEDTEESLEDRIRDRVGA
jgi:hypothetical protein